MTPIKQLISAAILVLAACFSAMAAVSIDRTLVNQVNAAPLSFTPVIITFDHQMTGADYTMLRTVGIMGGRYLQQLPIVLTLVNKSEFDALRTRPGIRSLYANHTFQLFDLESRTISGVEDLVRDSAVTALNGGLPVSGS